MEKKVRRKSEPSKSKKINSWQSTVKKVLHFLADTPLPEIIFLSSFILSRWWLNSDFSYPAELVIPIVMFGILASICFYIYRAIFGKGSAAHLAAILLSYSLYGYSFVHDSSPASNFLKIIPSSLRTDFTQSIVLTLALGLLITLITWTFRKLLNRYRHLRALQFYKVLMFAVVFIFAIQVVRCSSRYWQIRHELSYHYPTPSLVKPASASVQKKPDIYYLLFDRYTNKEILKNNFSYDNSELVNFLSNKGFVLRPGAYSNYPFTAPSVSSTLSLNYLTQFRQLFNDGRDWKSLFPYRNVLANPPVAQILKSNGYRYNQISSWWDFTRLGVNADSNPSLSFRLRAFGAQFYLSDLQRDILHKSVFSPWLKKGLSLGGKTVLKYDIDRNPRENFEAQISSVKAIANRNDKSQPNFSFAHILAPHPPYVFNSNGLWPSYDNEANDNGVDESIKYINELTYVNTQLKELIGYIQQKSPNAVIVLQADEGPYPKQFRGEMTPAHYYDPINLPLSLMRQKFGVLAGYYLPGVEPKEVEKINASVNSFRVVLNQYLGYNLSLLPDCQFAMGNKFNVYNYQLVSDKLKGHPADAACQKYQ